ncbi:hypothetical protein EDC04DRAFT_2608077 [Pisolithus marmoratus]|nr:hypothetical protein EDC04DRAFT_2608077 [Pisolithus marmoratus]
MYEVALTKATSISGDSREAMSTSILYNLARVYEDKENLDMAKEAYDKLLTHHPEYIDGWLLNPYDMARVQQAHMLANVNQVNEVHEILKNALTMQTSNLNLHAYYTLFFTQNNQLKVAKDFNYATLKDYE